MMDSTVKIFFGCRPEIDNSITDGRCSTQKHKLGIELELDDCGVNPADHDREFSRQVTDLDRILISIRGPTGDTFTKL